MTLKLPPKRWQLEDEIERLRVELEDLRRWKAMDKPMTAAMAVVQKDVEHLRAENAELRAALAFAASAIKSGEPWTDRCEEVIGAALAKTTEGLWLRPGC